MRKATAGSVVVPDFEMTLMHTSLPSHSSSSSERSEELILQPEKKISGASLTSLLWRGDLRNSITAREPR